MPTTDTRIVIRMGADGGITPDPGPDDPRYRRGCRAEEAEAAAGRNSRVEWTSEPADLEWRVKFDEGTPFINRRANFSSKGPTGGKIRSDPDRTEYKYTIWYRREGRMVAVDPKIVIQDRG